MNRTKFIIIISLIILFFAVTFSRKKGKGFKPVDIQKDSTGLINKEIIEGSGELFKVILIEIGSVTCSPCQRMKPVIDEIERKYTDVKVLLYDLREPNVNEFAYEYGILGVPTQIFLDANGIEYYRHVGFFPKERIEDVLAQKL